MPGISAYLPLLEDVVNKIPTDHPITKTEINQLDVDALKTLFYYTFPEKFSQDDYAKLEYLVELAKRVLIKLPNNAQVIASGDSPSKIVHLINLLWRTDEETYRIRYQPRNYGEYYDEEINAIGQYEYREVTKRIKFMTFPLSGLQDPNSLAVKALPTYLKGVLDSKGVHYQGAQTFIDLDHMEGGTTHRRLESALKELNPEIQLEKLNLGDLWSSVYYQYTKDIKDRDAYLLIMSAENTGSRCVPSYSDLTKPVPQLNIRRCNLVVTMCYLKAVNLLGSSPELPSPTFECNYQENPYKDTCLYTTLFYDIEYYDLSSNSTREVRVYVEHSPDMANLKIIEPGIVKFRDLVISYGQIIQIKHVEVTNIGDQRFPENTVGIITLVNGEKMRAKYTGYSFNTYKWSNDLVETNNRSGYIQKELIRSFAPE